MECEHAQHLLSEALEGDRMPEAARRHVDQCRDCLAFEAGIERIRRSLRFETVGETHDFADHVLANLGRRRSRGLPLPMMLSAVVCVALIGAAWLAATPGGSRSSVRVLPIGPDDRLTPSGDVGVLLAWSPSPMSAEAVTTLATRPGVQGATMAAIGPARMTREATEAVSLEVLALDTTTFPDLVPEPASDLVASLAPGSALVSVGSAELHRLEVGQVIELNGQPVTVAGIVPDRQLGRAEIAVAAATASELGISATTYAVFGYVGNGADLQEAVRSTLDTDDVRLLTATSGWSLTGGGILPPQLQVKQWYGEVALHDSDDAADTVDDDAEAATITQPVELLGEVTCNQIMIKALDAAMRELASYGADVPVAGDCYRSAETAVDLVDRHPWGIAIELNPDIEDPDEQDPLLVEVMRRWGFAWGGDLLPPEPAYFEYTQPPADATLPEIELTELADRLELVETEAGAYPVDGGQIMVLQRVPEDDPDRAGQVVVRAVRDEAPDAAAEPGSVLTTTGARSASLSETDDGRRELSVFVGGQQVSLIASGEVTDDDLVAIAGRLDVEDGTPDLLRLPEPPAGFVTVLATDRPRGLRVERHYRYVDVDDSTRTLELVLTTAGNLDDVSRELAAASVRLSTDGEVVFSGAVETGIGVRLGSDLQLVAYATGLDSEEVSTVLRGVVFAAPIDAPLAPQAPEPPPTTDELADPVTPPAGG